MEEIDKILTGNELFPVFQPVVSLENGDIFGYEALRALNQIQFFIFSKRQTKKKKAGS